MFIQEVKGEVGNNRAVQKAQHRLTGAPKARTAGSKSEDIRATQTLILKNTGLQIKQGHCAQRTHL